MKSYSILGSSSPTNPPQTAAPKTDAPKVQTAAPSVQTSAPVAQTQAPEMKTSAPAPDCVDKRKDCQDLKDNRNYCVFYKDWMSNYCCKTCSSGEYIDITS